MWVKGLGQALAGASVRLPSDKKLKMYALFRLQLEYYRPAPSAHTNKHERPQYFRVPLHSVGHNYVTGHLRSLLLPLYLASCTCIYHLRSVVFSAVSKPPLGAVYFRFRRDTLENRESFQIGNCISFCRSIVIAITI